MKQIRELEKETLQVISEIGEFASFPGLWDLASDWRNFPVKGAAIDKYIGIELDIRLRAEVRKSMLKRNVHLGMLIVPSTTEDETPSHSSYALVICKDNRRASKILRKIHFDYESLSSNSANRSREIKPSVHMQVCGKLGGYLEMQGYKDSALQHYHPDFEKPRIPSMPMCLALLINWIFLEFDCDKIAKDIRLNNQWRNHVAKAERVVLKPYFEACFRYLDQAGKANQSLVEERLYEVARA